MKKRTPEEKYLKEIEDIRKAEAAVEAIKKIIFEGLSKVVEIIAKIIKMFQKKKKTPPPTIPKLEFAKGGIIEPRPDMPIIVQPAGEREEIIPLSHEVKSELVKISASVEDLSAGLRSVAEAWATLIKAVCAYLEREAEALESYPNKRVVHLAKHAKKKRVRKKNINRIKKWAEREGR